MRVYTFGGHTKPVILLLPGTCCHWKANFGGVIPLLEPDFFVACVSYDGFDETEQSVMPVYQTLPKASITCLDYSSDMMEKAQHRAKASGLDHVQFLQGDVGSLPFPDESFDTVLSLNGFHAFPDKDAAFAETWRVLKPGGIFCGCFYIKGQNKRTDWFIEKLYVPKGFFTLPFETADSLKHRLSALYAQTEVRMVESMACFTCRKGELSYE